jgi:hypothetical protein
MSGHCCCFHKVETGLPDKRSAFNGSLALWSYSKLSSLAIFLWWSLSSELSGTYQNDLFSQWPPAGRSGRHAAAADNRAFLASTEKAADFCGGAALGALERREHEALYIRPCSVITGLPRNWVKWREFNPHMTCRWINPPQPPHITCKWIVQG